MPNSSNAKSIEWQIWFEKIIPYFEDNVRLIGHSLGAIFLAKYLHQNPLNKPVSQLILLAGGYDIDDHDYGSFKIKSAKKLEKNTDLIHLMHSRDDFLVPFSELDKYKADLPGATVHGFENHNHFLDAEFPELIELLKK
jgi:predicted alpha/beta hydrolase family esterase